jgi:GDP-L-fucose synthase
MKVLVFGSNGMVGSSVSRILKKDPYFEKIYTSNRQDTNLFNLTDTKNTINDIKPDVIVNAAAKVGGIVANNTYKTEFILENLKINMNLLESLIPLNNTKLINLGSSCIYPLNATNPISESSIMSGKLEPTNSPYAMAKLSAIELGNSMRSQFGHKIVNLMPTNLYGVNDNFDENKSHVIPGLISRMHKAKVEGLKQFEVWGTGKPKREFLYVDDLSLAIRHIIKKEIDVPLLNVGSNEEITISNLVTLIKNIVGFNGEINYDKSKPDGNPRKLLDSTKIFNYGWKPKMNLEKGIETTYKWYTNSIN